MSYRLTALTLFLALTACDKPAAPTEEKEVESAGLTLKADEVSSLGIATVPARAASYRRQISGYGVVVSVDTVAQTDSEVLAARAAAAQSSAAAARAQSLSTGEDAAVSREIAETARSKAVADQAALALASRKTEALFGRDAPWRDTASRQKIMARLSSDQTVLVRVTFPLGSMDGGVPTSLRIARLGANPKSWTTHTIWAAPADSTLPGRGFYALLDGSDLAQNEHITALVPVGSTQTGVLVPADALVYGENETWVYVQTKPGTFVKTRIDTGKALADGYFVAGTISVKAGQQVVTRGAGLLLARETNPSTEVEE